MSGPSSNNDSSSSSGNNSQRWARDYPEPYESAFERYLARNKAAWGTQYPEAISPPESPSSAPEQAPDEYMWLLPGGLQGQIADLLRYDYPDESATQTPAPDLLSGSDHGRDASPTLDPKHGAAPVYPAHIPSASGKTGTPGLSTPRKPSKHSTKSTPSGKMKVELQTGFVWNRESLALLCKWKEKMKKGSQVVIDSGTFPGHTVQSIEAIWKNRRAEARQAYEEVYGEGGD